MSCCGKKRETYSKAPSSQSAYATKAKSSNPAPAVPEGAVEFEYIGRTGMSLIGPATGKLYRFGWPGARVAVDSKDKPALVTVPLLRPVRNF